MYAAPGRCCAHLGGMFAASRGRRGGEVELGAVVMASSAPRGPRGVHRACKAYPESRAFFEDEGYTEGAMLHEDVRALADGLAAAGLPSTSGPRDVDERATRSLHRVRVWRCAFSLVSLSAVNEGPDGPPLYGEDVALALWGRWIRVFARGGTSAAQEDRFLAHVPSEQLAGRVLMGCGRWLGRRQGLALRTR